MHGPVAMFLLACTQVDAQSRDATGALAGCVTATTGYPIPGVKIDLSAKGVHRTISSNTTGCYELTGLPPGSYVVFARVPGFASVTRDQIAIAPLGSERRNVQMHIRSICECTGGPSRVASEWKEADAVMRLRITGHQPGPPRTAGHFPYLKHAATVRSVLKQHSQVWRPTKSASNLHSFHRTWGSRSPIVESCLFDRLADCSEWVRVRCNRRNGRVPCTHFDVLPSSVS